MSMFDMKIVGFELLSCKYIMFLLSRHYIDRQDLTLFMSNTAMYSFIYLTQQRELILTNRLKSKNP